MKLWKRWMPHWVEKEVIYGTDAQAAQWREMGYYVEEA